MIAAVILVDGPKIGAKAIGLCAAPQHCIGQQDAVKQPVAVVIERCQLGQFCSNIAAIGLAMENGASRLAKTLPVNGPAVLDIGGGHPDTIASAPVC